MSIKEEVVSTPAVPPKPDSSSNDDDEDYQPLSGTADSSPDSSSSSNESDKSSKSAPKAPTVHPKWESLTFEQLQGATALCGQPTLEALMKYPSAWKWVPPTHLASRDLPPSTTPAAQLASSMVMMDMPPQTDTPTGEPNDIPDLEETPPPPFPKKRHKEEDQD